MKSVGPLRPKGEAMSVNKREGLVFVISAPSGGGKTSLVERAVRALPDLKRSISCTTRPPRPGEKDGVDYEFISREAFQGRVASGGLIEWVEVYDHLYGTPRPPLESNRKTGIDTILAIEIQGARKVRELFPEVITIFVKPPSLEVLEARLRERKGEDGAVLERRLQLAREEMGWISEYEYTILNEDLEEAAGQLQAVIVAERCRVRARSSSQKGSS